MALLTKKEFAEKCGWPTNKLSVYIKRGKVLVGSNDMINTSEDRNAAFLERYGVDQLSTPAPVATNKAKAPQKQKGSAEETWEDLEDVTDIPSYTASERLLKHLDTLKRQREIERLQLDIEKKRGEVIPSELVSPLFLQHNQSIITEFKNMMDEELRVIAKKYAINANQVADIKGRWTNSLNESMKKATRATVNSIDTIIEEFADKKGVGQKD